MTDKMAGKNGNISRRGFLGIKPQKDTASDAERRVAVIADTCLAFGSISCRSCEDHCDERAIRFKPRIGKCELPQILEDKCTGCAECIKACPTGAIELTVRAEPAKAQMAIAQKELSDANPA